MCFHSRFNFNRPIKAKKGGFKSIQSEVCSDHTTICTGKHDGRRTWAVGFGSYRHGRKLGFSRTTIHKYCVVRQLLNK